MHRTAHYRIRIRLACLIVLIASAIPCAAQELSAAERQAWAQKLANLIPNSVEGTRTVQDLAALRPDDMYRILTDNWPQLSNSDIKQYILSCVVQNDNNRVLDILQLGVADSSLAVQGRALQFCESFGFDTFTENFSLYQEWRQKTAGKPLREVIEASMKAVVTSLRTADDERRGTLLNILVRTNLTATSVTSRMRRAAAIDAGLADAMVPLLKQQNNYMWAAYQIVRNLRPDEEYLRRVIMPLTAVNIDTAVRYQALSVLGGEQNGWASAPLLKMMIAEYPDASAEVIGQTLAQIGDPHVIPPLIALMESDNTPEGNRAIGNVLTPLTGVTNAYVRDAAWWKAWWARNNGRFAADVRAMPIPKLAVRARPMPPQGQNGALDPTRPVFRQIGGDPKRAYWFIDPLGNANKLSLLTGRVSVPRVAAALTEQANSRTEQPPPPPVLKSGAAHSDAPGLIVVLTSDGDAASAAPFWHEVALHALDRQYCIAVVQAAKWSVNQPTVWLTAADLKSQKEARFPTERLVEDVVADAEASRKIDASRVLLHGVGSAGTALYASVLAEKSPFHGYYVLSATFKSAGLPALDHAAGRRILIQNSKDDKIHPFWMAEAAQKLLLQKGAVVKLEDSTGYLGSQPGDAVMAQIKSAIDWLSIGK